MQVGTRVAVYLTTILAFVGVLTAPANADTEKPPPGISAEAWRTRPAFPVFAASADPYVCFTGHIQDYGWQAVDCSNDGDWAMAGTEGLSLRLEAVLIVAGNTGGHTCAEAHGQDYGWQGLRCEYDAREFAIGTTGQFRRMEAFRFGHTTRWSCNNAHGQNYRWQKEDCVGPGQTRMAGTTNQQLRLEAATATIL
ncbi:hydrophobic W protein [Lentzea californiensis]|nr:hydrophobic W protein [Lentzea californiensis]